MTITHDNIAKNIPTLTWLFIGHISFILVNRLRVVQENTQIETSSPTCVPQINRTELRPAP